MKKIFFLLLFVPGIKTFTQDSIPVRMSERPRFNMTLADTLITSANPDEPWLCKFTNLHNYGEPYQPYDPAIIYVYVLPAQLYRWNPENIIGSSHWLIVRKSDECYDGLPVYYHAGNF